MEFSIKKTAKSKSELSKEERKVTLVDNVSPKEVASKEIEGRTVYEMKKRPQDVSVSLLKLQEILGAHGDVSSFKKEGAKVLREAAALSRQESEYQTLSLALERIKSPTQRETSFVSMNRDVNSL